MPIHTVTADHEDTLGVGDLAVAIQRLGLVLGTECLERDLAVHLHPTTVTTTVTTTVITTVITTVTTTVITQGWGQAAICFRAKLRLADKPFRFR